MKPDADTLLQLGVIERILMEPEDFSADGAKEAFFRQLHDDIAEKLASLIKQDPTALTEARYEKFRKVGAYDGNRH